MKPVKTPDGKVTIPEEVFTSMKANKIGLKGETPSPCLGYELQVAVLQGLWRHR